MELVLAHDILLRPNGLNHVLQTNLESQYQRLSNCPPHLMFYYVFD